MRGGADVIYQATLGSDRWHGRADFLKRVERPSQLGAWSYRKCRVMTTADPDTSELARLAEEAANELLNTSLSPEEATRFARWTIIHDSLRASQSSGRQFRDALQRNTLFASLHGRWVQLANSGIRLELEDVANAIIDTIISGRNARSAFEELTTFLQTSRGVVRSYVPLSGVRVRTPVTLSGELTLVPWDDVPDSEPKDVFNPSRSNLFRSAPPGNCALCITWGSRQILFENATDANSCTSPNIHEIGEDIVRCITASGDASPAALGDWSSVDVGIVNKLIGGYGAKIEVFGGTVSDKTGSSPIVDARSLATIYEHWRRFRSSQKPAIGLALDRIAQAGRRYKPVDRAIELGVALEIMLFHGLNKTDRGEYRYRLALRGATFLGGDEEQRKVTFKTLREFYDLRSAAVHTGQLDEHVAKNSQTLADAKRRAASIALRIIERGSFPNNWEDEYVLGDSERTRPQQGQE